VYATPEVIDDFVVCSTTSKQIFCIDKRTASIRWIYNAGGKIFSSTFSVDGRVYCGCVDGFLYVINQKTGELLKKINVGFPIISRPIVSKGTIYFGCKGMLCAIKK